MEEYCVSLYETGSEFNISFYCWADDMDHAIEQAKNAYPGCEIITVVQTTEA